MEVNSSSPFADLCEFQVIEGNELVCMVATCKEPKRPLHMMTCYYTKDGFTGFQEEIDFFFYTLHQSNQRTTWTVLKEGECFLDLTQLGLDKDHLNAFSTTTE